MSLIAGVKMRRYHGFQGQRQHLHTRLPAPAGCSQALTGDGGSTTKPYYSHIVPGDELTLSVGALLNKRGGSFSSYGGVDGLDLDT